MKLLLLLASLLALKPVCLAQVYYDLDFNAPINRPGSLVATGIGPEYVPWIAFGTPTVASSFGQLASQPLVFDMRGGQSPFYYDQIELSLGLPLGSPLQVDFDFSSSSLIGSQAHFVMLLDTTAGVKNVYFNNLGEIVLFGGFYPTATVGTFLNQTAFHATVTFDQTTNLLSFFRNGNFLGSESFGPQVAISAVRFSYGLESSNGRPDGSAVAIDNVLVTSSITMAPVPEPGVYGAFASLSLVAVTFGRRWLQRKSRLGLENNAVCQG